MGGRTGLMVAVVLLMGGLTGGAGDLSAAPPSFTAETVQSHPQHGTVQGRMFVSEDGSRMETTVQGRQVVDITLPRQGIKRLLFPQERTYMELIGPAVEQGRSVLSPENPCLLAGKGQCQKVGESRAGGAPVEQWSISPEQGQGPIVVWWDVRRKMPLREEFPDGRVIQVTFKGQVRHDGRPVEHWETTYHAADGKTQTSTQYYDPELGMPVREEFPDGSRNELRKIRVTAPDPSWFAVPADFQRIEPPRQGGPRQDGQGGQGQPGGNPTGR